MYEFLPKDLNFLVCSYLELDDIFNIITQNNLRMQIIKICGYPLPDVNTGCEFNSLELVKYSIHLGNEPNIENIDICIKNDNVKILKYLVSLGMKPSIT